LRERRGEAGLSGTLETERKGAKTVVSPRPWNIGDSVVAEPSVLGSLLFRGDQLRARCSTGETREEGRVQAAAGSIGGASGSSISSGDPSETA
jgi:hypothetical protein